MEIEFDFREEQSKIFGPVLRPVAEVIFIYKGREILESAYVDSGADISLIPKSLGEALGLEIKKSDEITELKGIGERSIPIIIKNIQMKIGEKQFETRIAWALIEEVPMLLGRTDIFPIFDVCFKKNRKTLFRNGVRN